MQSARPILDHLFNKWVRANRGEHPRLKVSRQLLRSAFVAGFLAARALLRHRPDVPARRSGDLYLPPRLRGDQ